jgi:Leucine Rich repeat
LLPVPQLSLPNWLCGSRSRPQQAHCFVAGWSCAEEANRWCSSGALCSNRRTREAPLDQPQWWTAVWCSPAGWERWWWASRPVGLQKTTSATGACSHCVQAAGAPGRTTWHPWLTLREGHAGRGRIAKRALTWPIALIIRNVYARTPPLIITLPVARTAVAMSCRIPASSSGALSAMQEVDKGAPSGRTCFDLLENALLAVIARFLSAKELVRFAASCKRLATLEKECSELKHAQLCAHFTAAGAPDAVAWLTSNRGRVFSTFIVVTGAPYSVLKRLVEAPGHPPLLFPNSELFAALERHISSDAKTIYAVMADARAVYAATLERGEDVGDAGDAAAGALNEQLDRHRPGKLSLDNADESLQIYDTVLLDILQRRGIQLELHYEGDSFSNDVHEWRHSPSGGCSVRLRFHRCEPDGNISDGYDFEVTPEFVFDNDSDVWVLAAGLYLKGAEWLEREAGREDAGYEWLTSANGKEIVRRMSENDPTLMQWGEHHIDNAGVSAIAEALKVNNTLTKLNVSSNSIGDAGAAVFAEALKVNKSLAVLCLYNNSIGDAGAAAIAEALKVNNSLTTLNIHSNIIGDAGSAVLAEALKVNKSLTTLEISSNRIGDAGAAAIAEALKANKSLTTLYIHHNGIGDAGAAVLAEALKENKSLTTLNMNSNIIGDAGAAVLAEALKVNNTLTALCVSYNRIGAASQVALLASTRPGCTVAI